MARRSGRMGDYFYSWWRGDEVHASMVKQVSKAMRAIAYQTMVQAKANVVRREFMEFVEKKTKAGKYRGRWRVQKRYRSGPSGKRWRLYRRSKPGETPTNQTGVLKASIKYDFRNDGQGTIESFAGAVALWGRKASWMLTGGMASHALEYGGETRNHGGKIVRIAARPFVRPAGLEVLKSGLLRRSLENSLRRDSSRPPNLGIGWIR